MKTLVETQYIVKESGLINDWDSRPALYTFSGKGARNKAFKLTAEHNKKVRSGEISGPIWVYKRHCIYEGSEMCDMKVFRFVPKNFDDYCYVAADSLEEADAFVTKHVQEAWDEGRTYVDFYNIGENNSPTEIANLFYKTDKVCFIDL